MAENEARVVKYDVTEAKLAEVRDRFTELPDTMTRPGYLFVAEGLKEVKGYLASTEKMRVLQNEDALIWQRAVNAKAKSIKTALVPIRDALIAAKKVKDDEVARKAQEKREMEQARKDKIMADINAIQVTASKAIGYSANAIADLARALDDRELLGFEEFTEQANKVKLETVNQLWDLHTQAQAKEDLEVEQAENERISGIQSKINAIKQIATDSIGVSVGSIRAKLLALSQIAFDEFQEFEAEANLVRDETIRKLETLKTQAIDKEKADAALAEERRIRAEEKPLAAETPEPEKPKTEPEADMVPEQPSVPEPTTKTPAPEPKGGDEPNMENSNIVMIALDGLQKAKKIIEQWHNVSLPESEAAMAWGIYEKNAPEMKPINTAIARLEKDIAIAPCK